MPFFVLALGFTWAFHLVLLLSGMAFSLNLTGAVTWLYLVGLLGPLFAAVTVTARADGWKGVRALLKAGLRWKFHPIWYLFAVFVVGVLMFINVGIQIGGIPHPLQWMHFPLLIIIGQLWVVIGEEFGWRGYALPRMQQWFGSLGAALLIGVLWACWHLPMFFLPGSPQYCASFLSGFAVYIWIVCCWSIILTMLYNRTGGSVLVCMIFHAFFNIAIFTIRMPRGENWMPVLYLPVVVLAIWLLPQPLFRSRR